MNDKAEKEQLDASYKLSHLMELAHNVWVIAMTLSYNSPPRKEDAEKYKRSFRNMYDLIKRDAPDVTFILERCLHKFGNDYEDYLMREVVPLRSDCEISFNHPTETVASNYHEAGLLCLKHYFLETKFWDNIPDNFGFDDYEIHRLPIICNLEGLIAQLPVERRELIRSVFGSQGTNEADYSFDDLLDFTSLGRTRMNKYLENVSHEMPQSRLTKGGNERHSRHQVCILLEYILTQNPIAHVREKCEASLKLLRSIK